MRRRLGAIVLFLGGVCAHATVVTAPPATFLTDLSRIGFEVSGTAAGAFSAGVPNPICDPLGQVPNGGCSSQGVTVGYSNGTPSASIYGTYNGGPAAAVDSEGVVNFWFEVVGPSSIVVPLDFSATGSTEVSATGGEPLPRGPDVLSEVVANSGFNAGALFACSSNNNNPTCNDSSGATFDGVLAGSVMSNVFYEASVTAIGQIDSVINNAPFAASFMGSVDPSVTFDPAFTLPGYSLVFSVDAVPPQSTVPEPGTLALFAFGVAGLGFSRRKAVT
jgi:hypothetical protein